MKRYDCKETRVLITPNIPLENEVKPFDLWVHQEYFEGSGDTPDEFRWVVSIYTCVWVDIISYRNRRIAEEKLGISFTEESKT